MELTSLNLRVTALDVEDPSSVQLRTDFSFFAEQLQVAQSCRRTLPSRGRALRLVEADNALVRRRERVITEEYLLLEPRAQRQISGETLFQRLQVSFYIPALLRSHVFLVQQVLHCALG